MFAIIQAVGWPIWPLLLASVIAVALIIERSVSLRRSRVVPGDLLDVSLSDWRDTVDYGIDSFEGEVDPMADDPVLDPLLDDFLVAHDPDARVRVIAPAHGQRGDSD